MAKMETLFRNIVEDEGNNSLNDCTILASNFDENNYAQPQLNKLVVKGEKFNKSAIINNDFILIEDVI